VSDGWDTSRWRLALIVTIGVLALTAIVLGVVMGRWITIGSGVLLIIFVCGELLEGGI
jgi:hypothetical protein